MCEFVCVCVCVCVSLAWCGSVCNVRLDERGIVKKKHCKGLEEDIGDWVQGVVWLSVKRVWMVTLGTEKIICGLLCFQLPVIRCLNVLSWH